ncbi:MAG: hypothetical protein AVDCRST_MAG75-2979 [uncultured Propionibacteriaceae bacterium]|uniref:Uncharacterized protein n=1 Tax=uncultured Propionibacteriaceae bacterium TaxID=257457 RepID=A0A6J4PLC3_9ACTN|nr:MAG: hypothetical protein AVDCRST_MAG75-2979 [uncultured Propionibacteriaceae bacterium]
MVTEHQQDYSSHAHNADEPSVNEHAPPAETLRLGA